MQPPEPFERDPEDFVDEPGPGHPRINSLRPSAPQPGRRPVYDRVSQSPNPSSLSASLPTGWYSSNYGSPSPGGSSGVGAVGSGSAVGSSTELYGQLVEDLSSAVDAKGKRGRKPGQTTSKPDVKNKLERSRQSARECRARKKLRYHYLDGIILERERANLQLRDELLKYLAWCHELDNGRIPDGLNDFLKEMKSMEHPTKQWQNLL